MPYSVTIVSASLHVVVTIPPLSPGTMRDTVPLGAVSSMAMIPALERHGRLQLDEGERVLILSVGAATIDRMLADVKSAASGGRRRDVGFYSAIWREVRIRTFNDWKDPPPSFREIDLVAHRWHLSRRVLHSDPDNGRCGNRLGGVHSARRP
ncbi:MAG: hypothetical protein AB7O44_21115 [Hyphomicrobiaceae bacterium]